MYKFYDHEAGEWVDFNKPISEITEKEARRFLDKSENEQFTQMIKPQENIAVAFLAAMSGVRKIDKP